MIKRIKKDLALGIHLVRMAPAFKKRLQLCFLGEFLVGLAVLTMEAIAGNPFRNGFLTCYGALFYVLGCIEITYDYHYVFFSDFVLTSAHSKKIQTGLSSLLSAVVSISGFTLIAVMEWIFAKNCSGDVVFFVGFMFTMLALISGSSRKRYDILRMALLVPMLMVVVIGGTFYFFTGYQQKEIGITSFLLIGTKWIGFFRDKYWAATGSGYLLLLVAHLFQYVWKRYDWKKGAGKFFSVMKKKYT